MAGPIRIAIIANGKQARAEMEKTGLVSKEMGSTIGKVAKGMGLAFAGIEVAHLAGDMIKTAGEFQKSITLLHTAGGEATSNLGKISDGILKIAGQTGTYANDLAEGMYLIEKAGIRGAQGLTVLKNAAEGAAAENVDMATETQAVTSIMTSYHVKAADSAKVVNELVAASGAAKTTMQEFAGSLATVLPSASAAGLSFAEIGGAIATLTQHGTSAKEATQELASTLRNLQAPNNVASQEMQQLGLNVTDVSKNLGKRGLTGTLDEVVSAITHHMGPAGLVMLSAFKKSQSAGKDLQIMLDKMPPALASVSKQFLAGKIGAKEYGQDFKGMNAEADAMGSQFLSLTKTGMGFNNLLKSGNPSAQTFTDALKKVMGGAIGMNTALQLSGENMAGFKARVDEVNKAAQNNSGVRGWPQTLATFDQEAKRVKASLQALGIKLALPALPALANGFNALANGAGNAVGPIQTVFTTLKPAGEILGLVAKGVGAIPRPLKTVGIEAGVAALVLPRLAAGFTMMSAPITASIAKVQQFRAELTYTETRAGIVQGALGSLGSAAKTAAGIGGLVALSQGAQTTNKALGLLDDAAGGAATGFSLAGPWGAAIGGAAGAVVGLARSLKGTTTAAQINYKTLEKTEAIKVAKDSYSDLRDTLNQTTGAYTKNTRAALENWLQTNADGKKLRAALGTQGIGDRTIIADILGDPAAIQRVTGAFNTSIGAITKKVVALQEKQNNALGGYITPPNGMSADKYADQLQKQIDALNAQKTALVQNKGALEGEGNSLRKASKDQRDFYNATTGIPKLLGVTKRSYDSVFAKRVRGILNLEGVPKTLAGIKSVAREAGGLTKKDWTILLKAAHVDATAKQLAGLVKVGKQTGADTATGLNSSFIKLLNSGEGRVRSAATSTVARAANSAKGTASAGGRGIGVALGNGTIAGIAATAPAVAAAAAAAVSRAVAAARTRGKIHSPSLETMKIGNYLGLGMAVGLDQTHATLRTAGQRAAQQAIAGMQSPALDLHLRQVQQKASNKQKIEVVVTGEMDLRRATAQIHQVARSIARDEIDQDHSFWNGG